MHSAAYIESSSNVRKIGQHLANTRRFIHVCQIANDRVTFKLMFQSPAFLGYCNPSMYPYFFFSMMKVTRSTSVVSFTILRMIRIILLMLALIRIDYIPYYPNAARHWIHSLLPCTRVTLLLEGRSCFKDKMYIPLLEGCVYSPSWSAHMWMSPGNLFLLFFIPDVPLLSSNLQRFRNLVHLLLHHTFLGVCKEIWKNLSYMTLF